MRSTSTRPAPRSMRALKNCLAMRHPVRPAMRPAKWSASARKRAAGKDEQRRLAEGEQRAQLRWPPAPVPRAARRRSAWQCRQLRSRRRRPEGSASRSVPARVRCRYDGGGIGRDRTCILRGPHAMRQRPGQSLDVGSERRVMREMPGRVLADDVDDAGTRSARLCRLARPLARPGPRCSSVEAGRSGHPVEAVGGAGHHALEQAENAAHAAPGRAPRRNASPTCRGWRSNDRRHRQAGSDETFCAVHAAGPMCRRACVPQDRRSWQWRRNGGGTRCVRSGRAGPILS